MTDSVLIDVDDNVLIITINRPEARNAINHEVAKQIGHAIERLDSDDGLSVAILAGAGGTFCSGMDLKAFLKGEFPAALGKGLAGFVEQPPKKPIIGAVDGYALAAGMEIATACDLIVANENAQFGIPETKRSLVASGGGLLSLTDIIGKRMAMELALTGDFITAQRAHEIGFVNRITDGPALTEAIKLAKAIAENGPLGLIGSKRIINEQSDWSNDNKWQKQQEIAEPILLSNDAKEGAAAFAQKRKPVWSGS